MTVEQDVALVVGAGSGLSASLARQLTRAGMLVAVAARDAGKLAPLTAATGATAFACDAAEPDAVARLFVEVGERLGPPGVVIYNPSARVRGPIAELDPAAVARALAVTALGGFLVGQQAARIMVPRGGGTILFTGASASVKGYAESAAFAMGKFALRGLAQSMARELGPKNVHVAHIVIDGGIRSATRPDPGERPNAALPDAGRPDAGRPDSLLDPEAIAATYLQLIAQPRSAWTHELELRPWVEPF